MKTLVELMLPEIILCAVAGVLFLMGVSNRVATRRTAPVLALLALIAAGACQFCPQLNQTPLDRWQTIHVFGLAQYVKLLTSAMGVLLLLLAWPSNKNATGSAAMNFGTEAGEFYGLMLLSIAGVFMVAEANDIMLLFLGIELASIPTYIMVSISRPLPVAQEAGVKYFFLGALAAAVMLFGFSYLYGVTGTTKLNDMAGQLIQPGMLGDWKMLAVVLLIGGFAFKMAVVPLHVYAGDVYQGAATPVTAFLSFVPKISGFVALLKVLYAVSGGLWYAPRQIVELLWVLSVLTMTIGNVLGLVQAINIKRVFAYSSIAHSGYMLAAVAALVHTRDQEVQYQALRGVLFYLAAYGLMNIGAFGVLICLPSRQDIPATSAETFDDLAGVGPQHLLLSLAMAVSCFSLIGLPLTVGFFGKLYLIWPIFYSGMRWLVVILVINAAISAAYYLRIVAALFLRPEPANQKHVLAPRPIHHPIPVLTAVGFSMIGVLWLGIVLPATNHLNNFAQSAATHVDQVVYVPEH